MLSDEMLAATFVRAEAWVEQTCEYRISALCKRCEAQESGSSLRPRSDTLNPRFAIIEWNLYLSCL
jgi:hypothetical protein